MKIKKDKSGLFMKFSVIPCRCWADRDVKAQPPKNMFPLNQVKKMATGFGGGVGLYGDTCGALIGAVMAVSAVHGRSALPEGEPKEAALKGKEQLYGKPGLYRLFNQIPNRMKEKHGKTICRDLTSQWHTDWLCRDHALFCREIITDAAGIAADLILSDKDELASKPFGDNVEHLKD